MNKYYESSFTITMREGGVIQQTVWQDHAEDKTFHIKLDFDERHFPSRQSIALALLDLKSIMASTYGSVGTFDCAELDTLIAQFQDATNPPGFAEFMLTTLLKPARAEAVVGDLNAHFTRDYAKFGYNRAARFYWARTLRSLWPLLWRAICKAVKWGAIIDWVRWKVGL
jgi:hypothetical protein